MTETCPTCGNLLKHNCATDDRRLPIDRPCSACGDGDYNMEHHLHCPPFRHDAKEEKAPAQATREQLEAALRETLDELWMYYTGSELTQNTTDVLTKGERLLGGK